jgi:hypothetical protein
MNGWDWEPQLNRARRHSVERQVRESRDHFFFK